MDRFSPTVRPARTVVGYQKWRELLFIHWPISVEALRPLVPSSLSIDLWEGTAYVGLVPFIVTEARAPVIPKWLAISFLETNLRTYVHLNGSRPGVYFFSLDAASRLAVLGARAGFGLPYYFADMERTRQDKRVEYWMKRHRTPEPGLHTRYRIGRILNPAAPDTLQFFLLERYLLYTQRGPFLFSAQVHHSPYPVHDAVLLELEEDLRTAIGLPGSPCLPSFAHYSPGVDVEIFTPRRMGNSST